MYRRITVKQLEELASRNKKEKEMTPFVKLPEELDMMTSKELKIHIQELYVYIERIKEELRNTPRVRL